jgi:hypothetical protein
MASTKRTRTNRARTNEPRQRHRRQSGGVKASGVEYTMKTGFTNEAVLYAAHAYVREHGIRELAESIGVSVKQATKLLNVPGEVGRRLEDYIIERGYVAFATASGLTYEEADGYLGSEGSAIPDARVLTMLGFQQFRLERVQTGPTTAA